MLVQITPLPSANQEKCLASVPNVPPQTGDEL